MTPLERIYPKALQMPTPPLSPAVKVGNLLYVSGLPGFDADGKLAVGDFLTQMRQVMQNISITLAAAGTNWSRVVKVNVLLTRHEDVSMMNQIYGGYFEAGQYPARTTAIVAGLPNPDFLLEIECVAVLD